MSKGEEDDMKRKWLMALAGSVVTMVGSVGLFHYQFERKHRLFSQFEFEQTFDIAYWLTRKSKEVHWVTSQKYADFMDGEVLDYLRPRCEAGILTMADGSPLSYHYYRCDHPIATFVVAHGFNEYKEKYREMVYYLLQHHVQVVTYDQRGHGRSRVEDTKTQVDVADFDLYTEDLAQLMEQIVEPIRAQLPVILFGHSMGGAVAARYIQRYPSKIDQLVLNAPMFAIQTGKIPNSLAHLMSGVAKGVGLANAYAPKAGPYRPNPEAVLPMKYSTVVARERTDYHLLWKLEHFHYPTWGGSWQWLASALKGASKVLETAALQSLDLPILLFRGEFDEHVRAEGIYTFAQRVSNICVYKVPKVMHEIHLEDDDVVQAWITAIVSFIQQNKEIN